MKNYEKEMKNSVPIFEGRLHESPPKSTKIFDTAKQQDFPNKEIEPT